MCRIDFQTTPFFGPKRGEELINKIRSLEGRDVKAKDDINRLYGMLSILDAKASGLLSVTSMFLVLLVFFLTWSLDGSFPPELKAYLTLAYLDAVLLVISGFFCLLVMAINWKFLRKATAIDGRYSFESEILRLANVVDDRTHYYWLAWVSTFLTFIVSVAYAVELPKWLIKLFYVPF